MVTDIGEHLVGAALRLLEGCDVVDYNVRPPDTGMEGLGELDVVGLRFRDSTAFLCEVATHLAGLEYGTGYDGSIRKVTDKLARQRRYAEANLQPFPSRRYMLWCPVIPRGRLLEGLGAIDGLELVANGDYAARVRSLRRLAAGTTKDVGNPFFRTLQILEHLRD